jgi:pimeloyl-ACP methyl ester carboxylesterase
MTKLAVLPRFINLRTGLNRVAVVPRVHPRLTDRRIVLFIHGYNNNEDQATLSYRRMLSNLQQLDNFHPAWLRNVYAVYWPGDFRNRFLSLPTYNWQIRRANEAGERLAALLDDWQRGAQRELVIVAHSLGCRVALETLRQLRERGATHINVLACVLMAGAVQEDECADDTLFGLPDVRILRREAVLHSRSDRILRFAFPIGQAARLDQWGRSVLPKAVGLEGGPQGRWNGDLRTDMHPNGHSDYWKTRTTADVVSQAFGRRRRRTLQARSLPDWGVEPAEPLPSNTLASRDHVKP